MHTHRVGGFGYLGVVAFFLTISGFFAFDTYIVM
jgi:hypothetical protein